MSGGERKRIRLNHAYVILGRRACSGRGSFCPGAAVKASENHVLGEVAWNGLPWRSGEESGSRKCGLSFGSVSPSSSGPVKSAVNLPGTTR